MSDASMPNPFPEGTILGDHKLIRVIGRGGMGTVYEAMNVENSGRYGRPAAVKVLSQLAPENSEARVRFEREADALMRLGHAHILSYFDSGVSENRPYLVMELISNGSAADRIRGGVPITWPEATRLIRDACRALWCAHETGILHRDVKPANLLISRTGAGKLGDFGLSRSILTDSTGLTEPNVVLGTPDFMSPEQCRAEDLDERSDLYSLGATYHALLTGRPPFAGDNSMKVMFAHCSREIPDPRDLNPMVPAGCAAVVRKALGKRPADRYQCAREMVEALDALLETPETKTQMLPAARAAEPPAKPSRLDWRKAALIVAAALAVGGVYWAFPLTRLPRVTRDDMPMDTRGMRIAITPAVALRTLALDDSVRAVAFHPNGEWFAAGDRSGLVTVHDTAKWEERLRRTLPAGTTALAFSPEFETLALAAGGRELIRTHVSAEKGGRTNLQAAEGEIQLIAHDPQSRWLGAAVHSGPAWFISLWSAREGTRQPPMLLNPGPVSSLVISGDGRVLAGVPGAMMIRNIRTQSEERIVLADGLDRVMAMTPDGSRWLACGNNSVALCDGAGAVIDRWATGGIPVIAAAMSPDASRLAWSIGDSLVVWDAASPESPVCYAKHGRTTALAFSPNGRWLAAGGDDGRVRILDPRAGAGRE